MERGGVRWVNWGERNSIDASEAFRESWLLDSLVEGVHHYAADVSAVLRRGLWIREAVGDHVEAKLLWHFDPNAAKSLRRERERERDR
jgi:hypothetical protein